MSDNSNLCRAKAAKNDEFYTRLSDVEDELGHYARHFRDKVVYCNADDPFMSNFVKYFIQHFNELGLRELISTNYRPKTVQMTLDSDAGIPKPSTGRPRRLRIKEVPEGARGIEDVPLCGANILIDLEGDGDFRSRECIALLDECDIVCTNPPFSLFRAFFKTLVNHGKDFLIIGTLCASGSSHVFPSIQSGLVRVSSRRRSHFDSPDPDHPVKHIGTACWFSTLESDASPGVLPLSARFDPVLHPHYDNFDAIEVSRVSDIPMDYDGIMGVPLPFLFVYNPEQFEIVGITESWGGMGLKRYGPNVRIDTQGRMHNRASLSGVPVYEVEHPPQHETYAIIDGRYYIVRFKRILIRNRHPQPIPMDASPCPIGQTSSRKEGVDDMESNVSEMKTNSASRPEEASE